MNLLPIILAGTTAIALTVPVMAQSALTKSDILFALSRMGLVNGAVVPLGGANYNINNLTVEKRANGDFAVVFSPTPAQ
jgi:hypothetical protein